MIPQVNTKNAKAVSGFVQRKFQKLFPKGNTQWLEKVFRDVTTLFEGKNPDYAAIDLRYHDFEHTLQATVCLVLILEGRHQIGIKPRLSSRQFEIAVAAVLLHDSGYLKLRSDRIGTGAKYTFVHELRSSAYAAAYLPTMGANIREVDGVVSAINCTGPKSHIRRIDFHDAISRVVGCAVSTADYLAQMAAPDYLEKLPDLFREFQESYDFFHIPSRDRQSKSLQDLLRKTPDFWRKIVLPRLENDYQGVYHFLNSPQSDGANAYLDAIEKNIAKIKSTATVRRRKKVRLST
jgi:hypothetical protein